MGVAGAQFLLNEANLSIIVPGPVVVTTLVHSFSLSSPVTNALLNSRMETLEGGGSQPADQFHRIQKPWALDLLKYVLSLFDSTRSDVST